MIKYNFRIENYTIKRRVVTPQSDYNNYRKELAEDFHNRCGYCNSLDSLMLFEIDHFVPVSVAPHMKNDYSNLVYSCQKCNRSKSNKCSTIEEGVFENNLFYEPTKVDFNKIFYRNYYGGIMSDDYKGQEMIKLLKLYRPIYRYSWFIDVLNDCIKFFSRIKDNNNFSKEDKYKLIDNINKLYGIEIFVRDFLMKSLNGLTQNS